MTKYNDFVIRFANVNGSGSASANTMFAKALFRMGIPMAIRNLFPSNIQGLPTWFEVRANEQGHVGRRDGVDIMIAMNAETYAEDVASVVSGGYILVDSSKPFARELKRADVTKIGIPIAQMLLPEFSDPKQRSLFKNVVYVGALSALINMDFEVLRNMVQVSYKGKERLIQPNIKALELGRNYALEHLNCPLNVQVKRTDLLGERILVDGNTAAGLGFVYGGATVCAWYPITPSTSAVEAFEKFANSTRIDKKTGRKNFAIVQAEDELASIGMVIGAAWNGARAFTATSGPGISLMSEFLGLAYFAEIPAVVVDVQRAGPSTGMPTRTQQSDMLAAAYASHGDTKHVLLIPSTPKECFEFAALSLDLADRLQTPVLIMSDLELGMNESVSEPFTWDEARMYDRGKVLDAEALDNSKTFGRYLDPDGDGIGARTLPGTHPSKGAFFTRGTSRDAYAAYTESPEHYEANMQRLELKWQTASQMVPVAEIQEDSQHKYGLVYYGTTATPIPETVELLAKEGIQVNLMRIRAFPFGKEVYQFIEKHEQIFVVEQNRDAQLKTLLVTEGGLNPAHLASILYYGGLSIAAEFVCSEIVNYFEDNRRPRLSEVKS